MSDKTINVFLVEDYELIRMGIASGLNADPRIHVAGDFSNAEDCLAAIPSAQPKVVLMDITLPGMSGIDMTKKILSDYPDIKVIMLTIDNDDKQVLAALSAGAHAYCLKDIPVEQLADVIEQVENGAFWLDPKIASVAMGVFQNIDTDKLSDEQSDDPNPHNLTPKEHETLELLVKGFSNSEIAHEMGVTIHTAKAHISKIIQKLSVYDRVQAAVKAVQENLV